jgi:adenosylcobinamide amidohydrolase
MVDVTEELARVVVHEDEQVQVTLTEHCVALRLRAPHRVLSFAPYHGGFHDARVVAIHEVSNADLPPGLDPAAILVPRMGVLDLDGVAMLTSRRVAAFEFATCMHDTCSARVLVTAGMSNALRVGDSPGALEAWGTINVICHIDLALSDVALIEALSIVAEARTAAVIDSSLSSRRSGAAATGTGTDCIAVVAPRGSSGELYAGKHTAVGHVIGAAVQRAVAAALTHWKREYVR